ncbi:survival factor 1 family protein [Aspergillus stella-maris]|uniref:survival factor 1 family protein n=1 Tax=Aspergillus stella-maris TaxID=1810926 RepID=UPI003CCCD345
MNWIKSTLSYTVGTAEPEYGPGAIHPVTDQAGPAYSVLTKDDLKWKAMQTTNVETQIFYLFSPRGEVGSVQIIYNNVAWVPFFLLRRCLSPTGCIRSDPSEQDIAIVIPCTNNNPMKSGLMVTCQLNVKIWNHKDNGKTHLWNSDPLENHCFTEDMNTLFADNLSIALNEAGDAYEIKSARNDEALIDLVVKRTGDGFQVGNDGTTLYGTDKANPWGEMRHRFWARSDVTGSIRTPEKEYTFGSSDSPGRGVFIHAIQGMKPHHAAARWNFVTFQTEKYSAIMMEFTTPPSYANTKVNVGGVVDQQGKILYAGGDNIIEYLETKEDKETLWPEPASAEYTWKSKDGGFSATLKGPLGERQDRIDVLHHIPGVIKSLVGGVVGTKPYIYQFVEGPKDSLVLSINNGAQTVEEKGHLLSEATFIS